MRKLKIFQVNGVWQLGRPNQTNEEDDEDLGLAQEDVQGGQPQFAIPHQAEMLTQIWGGIQNIPESMRTMNIHMDRVDQRMKRIEDRIYDIERHQR